MKPSRCLAKASGPSFPTTAPPEHVEEICNYLEALNYSREQLRKKTGLPVSVRLLNGAHKRLMSGTRGQNKQPGEIRTDGDWEGWLSYFLEGIAVVAEESLNLIGSLFDVLTQDRTRYLQSGGATIAGSRLFESLPQHPLVTVKLVVRICDTTKPTAAKAIGTLCDAGILKEITGRSRDRSYAYPHYLDLLREGTELEE